MRSDGLGYIVLITYGFCLGWMFLCAYVSVETVIFNDATWYEIPAQILFGVVQLILLLLSGIITGEYFTEEPQKKDSYDSYGGEIKTKEEIVDDWNDD